LSVFQHTDFFNLVGDNFHFVREPTPDLP